MTNRSEELRPRTMLEVGATNINVNLSCFALVSVFLDLCLVTYYLFRLFILFYFYIRLIRLDLYICIQTHFDFRLSKLLLKVISCSNTVRL